MAKNRTVAECTRGSFFSAPPPGRVCVRLLERLDERIRTPLQLALPPRTPSLNCLAAALLLLCRLTRTLTLTPSISPLHYRCCAASKQVAMRSAATYGAAPAPAATYSTGRPRKNRWGAGAGGAAPTAAAAAATAVTAAPGAGGAASAGLGGGGGLGFRGNGVDAASSAAAAGLVAAAAAASGAGKLVDAEGGGGLGKRSRGFSEGGACVAALALLFFAVSLFLWEAGVAQERFMSAPVRVGGYLL